MFMPAMTATFLNYHSHIDGKCAHHTQLRVYRLRLRPKCWLFARKKCWQHGIYSLHTAECAACGTYRSLRCKLYRDYHVLLVDIMWGTNITAERNVLREQTREWTDTDSGTWRSHAANTYGRVGRFARWYRDWCCVKRESVISTRRLKGLCTGLALCWVAWWATRSGHVICGENDLWCALDRVE